MSFTLLLPRIIKSEKHKIGLSENTTEREYLQMGRRRGGMCNRFKEELAKELGFYDTVQKDGWGGITARDAGNMVKRAVQMAEESLNKDKV